jgi:hypothetical protein
VPIDVAAPPPSTALVIAPPVVADDRPDPVVDPAETHTQTPRHSGEGTLALEIRLLTRARHSVDTSPRRALSALDTADHEVGTGMFSEERSALRILALASLGRDDDAQHLGRAFLIEHPRGLFSARVRAAIDGAE